MIILKNRDEIEKIRRSCAIVSQVLDMLGEIVKPGVRTLELDQAAQAMISKSGATAAFKGYKGYPKSICTSVNDVIVHGIPNANIVLAAGDIISIDVGVLLDGFYGDGARSFAVGQVDTKAQQLLDVTHQALQEGIDKAYNNNYLHDISAAVQACVERHGFSVVRDFVGHGIGRSLHEEPPVPNFGTPKTGPKLKPGMVLAIEPMVNEGGHSVIIEKDGWTARTRDGKRSAHFEKCVAVLDDRVLVLA